MKKQHLEAALSMVHTRRTRAMATQQEHIEEVQQTIPEITEINRQLFQTSQKMMRIIRSGEDVQKKVSELSLQNRQAQAMIRSLLQQHGYPADYMDILYQCPKCNDTGYCRNQFCDCLLSIAGKMAVAELNRTAQIQLCGFDTFSLSYYQGKLDTDGSDCYTAMKKVLDYCKNYANMFHANAPSILMFGETGLGKTHLSLSIAATVLEKGYQVLYDSVINFLRRIEQEHFGSIKIEGDASTMDLLLSCDLLILDDLGTEFSSPFYQSAIYNLINTRMNRSLPTIISTNLNQNGISHQYNDRITSRIFSTYQVLRFRGEDIRAIKKQEKMHQAM